MVKTGVFKKIFALTAAITLISSFAVGVSAAPSITSTTTAYNTDNGLMKVTVNVDGIEGATTETPVQVTYYATNSNATDTNGVVYIDQNEVTSGTTTAFNFVAGVGYLQSDVKVAQTGGTEPATGVITGRKITFGSQDVYVPTEATSATVTFVYAPTNLYELDSVSVETGTATVSTAETNDDTLTVTLTGISGSGSIELKVTEKAVQYESRPEIIDAAIIAPGGSWGDCYSSGDRVISVLGKAINAAYGLEYGVIISKSSLNSLRDNEVSMSELTSSADVGVYKAQGKSDKDYFAVMVVDQESNESENAVIKTGTTYYVAVYCQTKAGTDAKYKVSAEQIVSI